MDSKTRAKLRAKASTLDAVCQIGLEGLTDNVIKTIDSTLENRELIKIKILQNSDCNAKILSDELAVRLGAEPVQVIGRVIVLYRYSKKKNVKHIEI